MCENTLARDWRQHKHFSESTSWYSERPKQILFRQIEKDFLAVSQIFAFLHMG